MRFKYIRKEIAFVDPGSIFIWALSLYHKETLLSVNLAIEYKKGKKQKYIKLRKDKVIIGAQSREYSVPNLSISHGMKLSK